MAGFGTALRLRLLAVIALFACCHLQVKGFGFPGQNTPPVFDFKREWLVPESEPIGSRIITVRTRDEERDSIVYGLEPAPFLDGSNYFTINVKTGDVFLKESLEGEAGNEYYLFITANDGHQTSKIEVYIRILGSVENKDSGAIASAIDVNPNNASSFPGLPVRRPFPPFGLPVPGQRPKDPYFAFAPPRNAPAPAPTHKKAGLLPKFANTAAPRTSTPGHPTTTHQPQPTAGPVQPAVNSTDAPRDGDEGPGAGGGGDGDRVELLDERRPGGKPSSAPTDRHSNRLDLITAFLPLLAAFAFAPIVGAVYYLLHRKCKQYAREKLIKSASHKKVPANKLESNETSISSASGDLEYNGAMFQQMRSKRALSNRYESNDFIAPSAPFNVTTDGAKVWEFPRHHLRFINILGEGCFGQVWKCEALDIGSGSEGPQIVAVKTLKEHAVEKEKKDLASELEIMKLLDPHPNVVTLLGCCAEREPIFVIMEYIPYGKLQTYLRESRAGNLSRNLSSQDLTSFAYQIAKGMEYIASKGIIHRDLAARNVLIGLNKTCKIADFGFARDVVINHVYERKSEGRLPIRWMAPESLYDNLFTTKSDVWSFGILMWEIVTLGSTPYPGMAAAEVMKKVRDDYRLEKPDHCKREMYNIMFYCWDKDPAARLSFAEVVQMLDKLLISENDYIELDRFPDHSYYNIITNLSGEKL